MSDPVPQIQRVLVTGGAGGIGLAITRAFAATGARVHIADPDAEALAAVIASDALITGTVCDITDPRSVAAMFADLARDIGGLDVLVNNAGIAGPTAPVEEFGREEWDAVLAVNLSGTFDVTRHAIPLLKRSPAGSIIVMSSLAGRFGYPHRVAYATTKWGLVGFTKTLASQRRWTGPACLAPRCSSTRRKRRTPRHDRSASPSSAGPMPENPR